MSQDGDEDSPRVGKWLLWLGCSEAVASWTLLAERTRGGDFWQAKVAATRSSDGHVVCVYTRDYLDVENVRGTGMRLWQLGLCDGRTLWYKPDSFTEADVYVPGSIYRLRAGQTYLATTPGLDLLSSDEQAQVRKALAALPVLPRLS